MEKDKSSQSPEQKFLKKKAKGSKNAKDYNDILSTVLHEGETMFGLQNKTVFLSSTIAGLEIGFSYLLICSLYFFWDGTYPDDTIFKLFGFVYPVGFIMVIVGKSALFTEQTSILALPVLNGQRSVFNLFRIWCIVILGNIIGGMIFALFIGYMGPHLDLFTYQTMARIGEHILHFGSLVIFFSAVTAGWLMGLLTWLLSSIENSITRLVLIFMITAIIGFSGFHHSIIGNIEVFGAWLHSDTITFLDYIKFLGLTLVGNGVGGALVVALFKYRVFQSNYTESSV